MQCASLPWDAMRRPSLMCPALNHILLPTGMTSYLSAMRNMNVSRRNHTSKGIERWNMHPSPHWSSQQQGNGQWGNIHVFFLWKTGFTPCKKRDESYSSTMSWLCCRVSPPCYTEPFNALGEVGPVVATPTIITSSFSGDLWVKAW